MIESSDMGRSPLAEAPIIEPVSDAAGEQLIDVADQVIIAGLDHRRLQPPERSGLHADLHQTLGAFVTLTVRGELNGCIGSIEGEEPLGESVARHAWSAAFTDPRLPPLRWADYEHLEIEVSVLAPLADIAADSRPDLLGALRPGRDGLLISSGTSRAVFLPSVWEQLPAAEIFVERLFVKAGIASTPWPDDLRASRFTAQKISRRDKRLGMPRGS